MIDYTRDIVAFFRDLYPLDLGKPNIPPFLETWLYTAFPLPDGNPQARNVLDSRSKKQGKSTLAGVVALYLASRRRYSEVVIAAADKDQAKDRVFRSVKYAVEVSPVWRGARVYKDVIELDNGSTIQAISSDWKGSAGGNYSGVIFDELHTYTTELQRRIYDELVIPPTQPDGVRWISTYAGFLGESNLLKEIWDKALTGERLPGELPIYHLPDAAFLALIDQGETSWRMPWSTPEYMRSVRETERPNTYTRLWLNEWVSNESEFITPEQWAACYDPAVKPLTLSGKQRVVFGADASTSRDLTALVGAVYNERTEAVEVVYTRVWKPKILEHAGAVLRGGKPSIDLVETIGAELLQLHNAGVVAGVVYDPYQLHAIGLELEKAGVRVIELPQTTARTEADQALYDAIISRRVRHYNDPTLNEHVNNAVALESSRGYRLAKDRTTRKIDAAVALAMAHYGARETIARTGRVTAVRDPFAVWPPPAGETFSAAHGWHSFATEPHPPGVTWRNCKRRNKGCEACVAELEESGYYDEQQAIREGYTPTDDPEVAAREAREAFLYNSGIANRLLRNLQETQNDGKFLQNFWRNVNRR